MGKRTRWLVGTTVGVLAITGGIVGVAVAQTGSSSPATNSAGCVPRGTSVNTTPNTCGPGNYPISAFYKNSQGQIALACGDHVLAPGETTTTVKEGEPDPACHPMSESDMAKAGTVHPVQAPAPTP